LPRLVPGTTTLTADLVDRSSIDLALTASERTEGNGRRHALASVCRFDEVEGLAIPQIDFDDPLGADQGARVTRCHGGASASNLGDRMRL